nr:bifunctional 3-deoxy-7-phosphoheptulonate synthase/chorismate mutase [Gracilibacillus massiliensis]
MSNQQGKPRLLVSRDHKNDDTIIKVKQAVFGGTSPILIAGPCSVESRDQLLTVASALKKKGVTVLRGGAFKPRTSPYDFQGLGEDGLKIMKQVADETDMVTISEIMSPDQIDIASNYIDIFQIGARNMQNFELLKAVGQSKKPVLLKRGASATLEEFKLAAEYILDQGNDQVMLIERGIRTFEKATRNTLDISAVPILKKETHLPVFVDVSHSTGRKDILLPCAKASLAAGADGVMVEVHPNPPAALSDAKQQIDINEFQSFWQGLTDSGLFLLSSRCNEGR